MEPERPLALAWELSLNMLRHLNSVSRSEGFTPNRDRQTWLSGTSLGRTKRSVSMIPKISVIYTPSAECLDIFRNSFMIRNPGVDF